MSTSNWTGRTNRTLVDAFGPHTSTRVEHYAQEQRPPLGWRFLRAVICFAAAVAIGALLGLGV